MLWNLLMGLVFVASAVPAAPCSGSLIPEGEVVRSFAPVGAYGGHWGVDVAMPSGDSVRAMGDGVVSFSGVVAGIRTVTILHSGSLRTSYSYLSSISVDTGQWVRAGAVIGRSGSDHGMDALHFSVRVGGRYVDPVVALSCSSGVVHLAPLDP